MTLAVGRRKSDDRSLGVADNLSGLASEAFRAPALDVPSHVFPHETGGDHLGGRLWSWMAQAV